MEQRLKGVTIALTGVAVIALGVSFFASVRAKQGQHQLRALQTEREKLAQANRHLEQNLRQTTEQYARQMEASQELQTALAQEQERNQRLVDQMERQPLSFDKAQARNEKAEAVYKVSKAGKTNFSSR